MSDDWGKLLELGHKEMEAYKIGTKVRLNFLGNPEGRIIEIQQPIALLAPRYKARWSDGGESGFLLSSELTIIE